MSVEQTHARGRLSLRNATKADPDRNMLDSEPVYTLSHQRCLPLQLLRPPRAIGRHDENGAIRCFLIDAIQFEEVKAALSS
jgi:hypothetical protein